MRFKRNKSAFSIMGILAVIFVPVFVFGSSPDPDKLTVEGCMEMTGRTKEQCSEMMDKIKSGTLPAQKPTGNPSSFSGNKSSGVQKEAPKEADLSNPADTDGDNSLLVEKISKLKAEKEEQLDKVEARVNRIIEFLDSKNVDCNQLKNDFNTFKEKVDSVLNTFDSYIGNLKNNSANQNDALIRDDRLRLKSSIKELVDFYTNTIRSDLNEAMEKLQ